MNEKIKRISVTIFIAAFMFFPAMGLANAADVGTSTDTTGELQVTVNNEPVVLTDLELLDESYTSILDAQVDVNTEITCNITVEDTSGWDDVDFVIVGMWYDGGNDANTCADQTTGHNYKLHLMYNNTSSGGDGETAPTASNMGVWYTMGVDNDQITEGTHSVTEITANQKYKLTWKFTLGYQFKQADIPDAADQLGYNNVNSWNIRANGTDAAGNSYLTHQSGDSFEFGIYKYVYLDSGANTWNVGNVAPGANSDATASSITTRSNDDFDMTVWMQGDLTCSSPSDTIPTSGEHVTILAGASATDDIGSNTAFTDNNEANEITILSDTGYGDHSTYRAGNAEVSLDANFNIAVPYGTLPGVYTAGLTFQMDQV